MRDAPLGRSCPAHSHPGHHRNGFMLQLHRSFMYSVSEYTLPLPPDGPLAD